LQDALSGDRESFDRLGGEAEQLLSQARERFAAGPGFAEVFKNVQEGLRKARESALGEAGSISEQQLEVLQDSNANLSDMRESLIQLQEQIEEQTEEIRASKEQAGGV